METIDTLLQKLQRLRDDPAATPAERTAAADKLRARLTRLGLTEADLLDGPQQVEFTISSTFEHKILIQLAGQISCSRRVTYLRTKSRADRPREISIKMPNSAAAADLRAAWLHYGGSLRETLRKIAAERRTLHERARQLDDQFATAFINKFSICPDLPDDAPDKGSRAPMTMEELRRMMATAESITGDPWSPRRRLETAPLQLT